MNEFESLDEAMAAGAARAVKLAMDANVCLDYSIDSIRTVEQQLASLHQALPKGFIAKLFRKGPSAEEIDMMAMTFGAYVGEVLRRHLGGTWSYQNSLQPPADIITLHLGQGGGETWPQIKVKKRLILGAGDDVWFYAQALIAAQNNPPTQP